MKDQISIHWHVDDVLSVDDTLSEARAREILHYLKRNHDPSIGITWEIIEETIADFERVDNE